jgi:UDP-glucuronate 4-epimerase
MDYQKSQYEVVNLGNNCSVALLEMVETIGDALGLKPRMEFLPEQPGDVPQTRADISKAQKLIDYRPETPFREGIRRFAEWFEQERVLDPRPA